jgi:hypothetical protein
MAYFEQTKIADDNGNVISPATENGILQRIFNILSSPLGYDKSQQRQRVTAVVESGTVTTVSTVTTVTTLTTAGTLTNVGTSFNGDMLQRAANMSAWRNSVRSLIS